MVFDFDGLVLDTEMPEFRAWAEVYERHGCEPLSVEEWGAAIGTQGGLDPVAVLQRRLGQTLDADEVQRVRAARRDELLAVEVALPGVERWLEDAHRLGLAVGVASSSPVEWVERHLRSLELVDRFACLSCFGPGLRAKPAPDLYLAACDALGVAPSEAVAVEDSPHGIAAAKAAGLACVAVPNALTRALPLGAPDLVVASLADVSLEAALGRLAPA